MNQQLQTLRTTLTRKQGQQQKIDNDLINIEGDIVQLKEDVHYTEKARIIIQKVAKATQAELEYYISELVTLAFASVFPDPYQFGVAFEEKRGKTECRMRFLRDGHEVNPLSGSGGGPLDIASTTLQFTIWSLNKTRAIIGLDEPFRFLSRDLQPKAGEMLKEVSKKLGLQILMVTHSEDLAACADKGFKFDIRKGITYVDGICGSEEPKPTRRRRRTQKPLGILP